jgi:hypothetical protein
VALVDRGDGLKHTHGVRLVQFETSGAGSLGGPERRVGRVDGDVLRVLDGPRTTYELARAAIERGTSLTELVGSLESAVTVDYARVIDERRLHPPLTHPDPARLLVSGTGLTHLGSAATRAEMHQVEGTPNAIGETDSMKLFRLGLEHGKPEGGGIGVQPEWFFKGNGCCLVRPGHDFEVPDFSLDAGEEPEIVGLYVVADDGGVHRVGFALGNELSDHVTERENYLYLAHSKLRPCSVGPELLVGDLPPRLHGESRIVRDGQLLWRGSFKSGECNMSHRILGLEHHHFKYAMFRSPGSAHVHFFGTATISFAAGIRTRPADRFEIECPDFGKPLVNTLSRSKAVTTPVHVL